MKLSQTRSKTRAQNACLAEWTCADSHTMIKTVRIITTMCLTSQKKHNMTESYSCGSTQTTLRSQKINSMNLMQNTYSWRRLWDQREDWTKRKIEPRMLTWQRSPYWPNTFSWLNSWDGAREKNVWREMREGSWEGIATDPWHGGTSTQILIWTHQRRKNRDAYISHVSIWKRREMEESRTDDALADNPSKNTLRRLTHHYRPHYWQ